jgi:hypothetical protein
MPRRFWCCLSLLAFVSLVLPMLVGAGLARADEGALDVIEMESGVTWEGRIVAEDEKTVTLVRGSDSGGTTRLTLQRGEIRQIRRGAGGPAPRGGARPLRDEWFLLRSGGRIIGKRNVQFWSVATGGEPGYRLEDLRVYFAQGTRLPETRTHLQEYTDLELHPRLLSFREVGEPSSEPGGPRRYERNVSGRVTDGVWKGVSVTDGSSRGFEVRLGDDTRGRLGLREHLLRQPRAVRLYDARILDADAEGLVTVRAGFAALPRTAAEKRRGHEFHWEQDGRRLISYFDVDTHVLREEIAEGVTAVPVSREQAEAAGSGDDEAGEGTTEAAQREIRLPEAGIGFVLPDRLWSWTPQPPSPLDRGWRVLGRLETRVTLADVRIEWHAAGPDTERDPAQVEGWLLRRLRAACPDLRVVSGRRVLPALEGAWQMVVACTLKGERVQTRAIVIDRTRGRVVLLLACPASALAQGEAAWTRFVESLRLL